MPSSVFSPPLHDYPAPVIRGVLSMLVPVLSVISLSLTHFIIPLWKFAFKPNNTVFDELFAPVLTEP
jgi:hypothetical protein